MKNYAYAVLISAVLGSHGAQALDLKGLQVGPLDAVGTAAGTAAGPFGLGAYNPLTTAQAIWNNFEAGIDVRQVNLLVTQIGADYANQVNYQGLTNASIGLPLADPRMPGGVPRISVNAGSLESRNDSIAVFFNGMNYKRCLDVSRAIIAYSSQVFSEVLVNGQVLVKGSESKLCTNRLREAFGFGRVGINNITAFAQKGRF